jgi:hypothetical protein
LVWWRSATTPMAISAPSSTLAQRLPALTARQVDRESEQRELKQHLDLHSCSSVRGNAGLCIERADFIQMG